MNRELGEIILERDFKAKDDAGNISNIKLRIGKPEIDIELNKDHKNPEDIAWFCLHQITGIGSERINIGRGIDNLDAFLTTLKLADASLKFYARVYHKNIMWKGGNDLGLPSSGYENVVQDS
jgi:hypothetical protein